MSDETRWRRCAACKKPIAFGQEHYVCSVSTCNRKRTGMVFCTVSCWEVHLPIANHREAWAEDRRAPSAAQHAAAIAEEKRKEAEKAERKVSSAAAPPRTAAPKPPVREAARPTTVLRRARDGGRERVNRSAAAGDDSKEILIVASRLKDYIRSQSGFNTSDRALIPLSRAVRSLCREAIDNARRSERLTVMDRDVPER